MRSFLQTLLVIGLALPLSLIEPTSATKMTAVVIQLNAPPAVVTYAAERPRGERPASAAARSAVEALQREQGRLASTLEKLDGVVLARMQRAYNGLIVLIPQGRVATVRALNGVRAVYPAVRHRSSNARAVSTIGAPEAWTYADGATGRSQKIAIIDTGIDYTHADFGGPGTTAAFARAGANTAVIESGSGFPSAKMPAGIDLVGDRYNADDTDTSVPVPDPDPLDCYGHGTHVAGTAGGYGVAADGRTYRGPYDNRTPLGTMRIGPGVAPEASLYPVKIFGCAGSTVMTPLAIDWAIDPNGDNDFSDRMDVVNLSLGSPFGSGYDASTVAADNAALAGVVVVASAGNDGDTTFAVSTPGTADRAIAVAADGARQIASFSSRGPRRGDGALKPDLAAPGVGVYSAARGRGSDGSYLSGTSMAAPLVAGAAALVRQQHPAWSSEQIKAALINTTTQQVYKTDGASYSPTRTGAGQVNVVRAVRTTTVAYAAEDTGNVHLSFGFLEVIDRWTTIKNIRLTNDGDGSTQTFSVRASPTLTTTGVAVRPLVQSVTLRAGESATIPVLLDIPDARRLIPAHDATMVPTAFDERRHQFGEIAGSIAFVPDKGTVETLHVPYFAVARRAANMTAAATHDPAQPVGEVDVRFGGTTSLTTTLASIYELQHRSPKILPSPTEGSGVLQLGEAADLQYVGVASNYDRTRPVGASTISFGLATYEPWSTPSEVTVAVEIDADRDGVADRRITTVDGGPAGAGGVGDVFLVEVTDLLSGATEWVGRLNYVDAMTPSGIYHGRVMGFAVGADQLGLREDQTRFRYRVATYHRDVVNDEGPVLLDVTPTLTYDLARPGFATALGSTVVKGTPLRNVARIPDIGVPYVGTNIFHNRSLGLLVLHHTNISAAQAQELSVPVIVGPRVRVYLPFVGR